MLNRKVVSFDQLKDNSITEGSNFKIDITAEASNSTLFDSGRKEGFQLCASPAGSAETSAFKRSPHARVVQIDSSLLRILIGRRRAREEEK